MTKKRISVWFLISAVLVTATLTFMLTVLYGGSLVGAEDAVATVTESAAEEETEEKQLSAAEINQKLVAKITELMAYYNKYYVGELDVDALIQGVAEGLVAYSGDKYGSYHTVEEYKALISDYGGEFAGIGVTVTYNTDYFAIEILSVMNNSPALSAGLQPDDLIIAVDGVDVAYLGYNEAVNCIRGEVGTAVTLTIARGEGYKERFDVSITRQTVEEQTVTYDEIISEDIIQPIGYVRISSFDDKTPAQFKEAMGEGLTNNVHGFIIDLRNNGGGTLNSVVSMLDMILPEGPIVRIQYKSGEETVYKSDAYGISSRVPIIILVNGNTASAAELFTSALRDYGRAIIVGETTYGKGTVQSIIRLSDGSGLRLSTALYAPPYSDNFEGVGITPDITVSLADEYKSVNLYKLDYENDAQLKAAVNLYK
ncbi:MAG: S41 family peptidase [Clostridia bacterium]|nr:S41 family peptidase [Clostridia bacterium]